MEKTTCVHGLEDNIVRTILFKLIYRFNAVFIRISADFSVQTDKLILKFLFNWKGPRLVKTTLKKKNIVERFPLPDFKAYYKAIVLKTVCKWHKDKQTDEQQRINNPEVNPYLYGQLIFNRVPKQFNGEKSLYNKWFGTREEPQAKD